MFCSVQCVCSVLSVQSVVSVDGVVSVRSVVSVAWVHRVSVLQRIGQLEGCLNNAAELPDGADTEKLAERRHIHDQVGRVPTHSAALITEPSDAGWRGVQRRAAGPKFEFIY